MEGSEKREILICPLLGFYGFRHCLADWRMLSLVPWSGLGVDSAGGSLTSQFIIWTHVILFYGWVLGWGLWCLHLVLNLAVNRTLLAHKNERQPGPCGLKGAP